MTGTRFEVPAGPVALAAERWEGEGAPVVMLHAGVADRRAWHDVAGRLSSPVVVYDRRGFGETPYSPDPFTHLGDLLAVLGSVADGPAWLVGNSQGGLIALDAALTAPERVAGLVLIAPAVSGLPEPDLEDLDPATASIIGELIAADEASDTARVARIFVRLWLDGPNEPEGRVGGAARELAIDMNERILGHGAPDEAGEGDVDAWSRLEELNLPMTVIWGDRDPPFSIETYEAIGARVPGARKHVLEGVAHLPMLEQPAELSAAIEAAVAGR